MTNGNIRKQNKESDINRPQVGSGPTYSDSPSDNVNSSITSSPTDTLRTLKNSGAKVIKNLTTIKVKIKRFKNNDYHIDYSNGWNDALVGLRKLLQLNYRGGSNYANYDTPRGVLSFRLSGHNANGNNFSTDNVNISVFVALYEYEHIQTSVRYVEFRISEEIYSNDPQKVVYEIIAAFERTLNGDAFEINKEIAEKTLYEKETESQEQQGITSFVSRFSSPISHYRKKTNLSKSSSHQRTSSKDKPSGPTNAPPFRLATLP